MARRIYFSLDIETNGLAAGINSMISLGVAAIDMDNGHIVGTFKLNIAPLSDLAVDPGTLKWWSERPEAYKKATDDSQPAAVAMAEFVKWVKELCDMFQIEKPVCAAWKPGFDIAFVRYYLHRFIGSDIFGRAGSGLDIKTLTAIALNQPFSETQIGTVPAAFKGGVYEHSHDALEDAIEQAKVMYTSCQTLQVRL